MSSLDAITRRLRDDSRADFAFILTRKGRLLTADAPPEMPEAGRATCVDAARDAQAATRAFVELTMAREELVPYGGAAPVDVFIAPCGEAVVCLVLATWTDSSGVGPAFEEHLAELVALLDQAKAARAGKRTGKTIAPPRAKTQPPPATATPARVPKPAPSSRGRTKKETEAPPKPARGATARTGGARPPTMRPPAGRSASTRPRALSGLVELSKSGVRASERMQSSPTIKMRSERPRPPPLPGAPGIAGSGSVQTLGGVPLGGRGSLPAIELGEAPLGRESLAAIEAEGRARGSLPMIEIGEAPLGRESLAAIEAEGRATGSLPSIEVAEGALGRESLEAIEAEESDDRTPTIEVGQAQLGRESLAAIEAEAVRKRSRTPAEIRMSEALLGKASLAAIENDARPSTPEIHIGGRSALSDASLEAIARDEEAEGQLVESGDDVPGHDEPGPSTGAAAGSVPPVPFDGRATQPWAEAPRDASRTARPARAGAPAKQGPRMKTIPAPAPKLELTPPRIPPPPAVPPLPGALQKSRKRKHNSNVDLWHQALGGMLAPGAEPAEDEDGAVTEVDVERPGT